MLKIGKETRLPEARRSVRIQEKLPITWQSQDGLASGKARIRNISDSGMLVEAKSPSPLEISSLLAFEPISASQANAIPIAGRLVWAQKKGFGSQGFLWGIEFVEPAQEVLANIRDKIKIKIAKIRSLEHTVNFVGAVLIAAMIALAAFALREQAAVQQRLQESSDLLLSASFQQADLYAVVSNDLKATKAVLAETETLLSQANEQNSALQSELQGVQASLKAIGEENVALTQEVNVLKEKLRPFEGEIASIEEGKASSVIVRKRLREIKIGINGLKRKAVLAHIAAQKEKDRILYEQGNHGFVVSNNIPASQQPVTPPKKVKIDVNLVE